MWPRFVSCKQCGKSAIVRAYTQIEYDQAPFGRVTSEARLLCAELLIDCPKCGTTSQGYRPEDGH